MGDSYEKKTDFTDDMLSGCGSDGVTREEYESVIAERDSYREQVEEYEKEKSESLERPWKSFLSWMRCPLRSLR